MAGYKNYVSFEIPQFLAGEDNVTSLSENLRSKFEQGLREMLLTEEGQEIWSAVSEKDTNGKISIVLLEGENGGVRYLPTPETEETGQYESVMFVGTNEFSRRYYSPETEQFEELSVQRFLWHEAPHLALPHDSEYPDEIGHNGPSPQKEAEATSVANYGMKKYYNEPERILDPREIGYENAMDFNGNGEFKLNTNFDPNGYTPSLDNTELEVSSENSQEQNYRQGVDGTAFTTQVDGQIPGSPAIDKATDRGGNDTMSVDGKEMSVVFSATADPAPGNVEVVNAMTLTTDKTSTQTPVASEPLVAVDKGSPAP